MGNFLFLPIELRLAILDRLDPRDITVLRGVHPECRRFLCDRASDEVVITFEDFLVSEYLCASARVLKHINDQKMTSFNQRIRVLRFAGGSKLKTLNDRHFLELNLISFMQLFPSLDEVHFEAAYIRADPSRLANMLRCIRLNCDDQVKLFISIRQEGDQLELLKVLRNVHSLKILHHHLGYFEAQEISQELTALIERSRRIDTIEISRDYAEQTTEEEYNCAPWLEAVLGALTWLDNPLRRLKFNGETLIDDNGHFIVLNENHKKNLANIEELHVHNPSYEDLWEILCIRDVPLKMLTATADHGRGSLALASKAQMHGMLTKLHIEANYCGNQNRLQYASEQFWGKVIPNIAESVVHLTYTCRDVIGIPFEYAEVKALESLSFLKNSAQALIPMPKLEMLQTSVFIFDADAIKIEGLPDDIETQLGTLTTQEINKVFANKPKLYKLEVDIRSVPRDWGNNITIRCHENCFNPSIFDQLEVMQVVDGLVMVDNKLELNYACEPHMRNTRTKTSYYFGIDGRWHFKHRENIMC